MKKNFTLLVSLLILALALLCGCKGNVNLSSAQKSSNESAISFKCEAVVKDDGNSVYTYSKEMSFRDTTATVTVTEGKLNSSFVLENNSTTDTYSLDRTQLQQLSFDKAVISEQSEDENGTVVKGTVAKDNIAALLNEQVNANDDATFSATVVDGKLKNIVFNFDIASQNLGVLSVELSYSYNF